MLYLLHFIANKLCGSPPQYAPAPCKLTFDFLTLKVVSESRLTWATSVPILVFLSQGTGISWLMRGMATLLQGNQELLVVRD